MIEVNVMADQSNASRAQASEVHESTGDANASPNARGDEEVTRQTSVHDAESSQQKVNPDASGSRIIEDESDDGGPVVIEDRSSRAPEEGGRAGRR